MGSDGDEWVLINEGAAGRACCRKSGTSPSGSPKAKKSRSRKSGAPARLTPSGALLPAASGLQYVSGRKISGKIHRRRVALSAVDDAILSDGDKLLHEIERGDFPTIEEGLKSSANNSASSGAAARGKSYAEIAKKLPPAASHSDSSCTPSPQSLSATATTTTTSCSSEASSSCEDQVQEQDPATGRRKSPAIIIVNLQSHSHAAVPSASSKASSLGKPKKKKRSSCHGLNGQMEGSWFVTPPPCFTKPNTFDMTSSPMEDMLIEKPVIGSPASDSFLVPDQEEEEEEDRVEDEVPLSPVHHSSPLSLIPSSPAISPQVTTGSTPDLSDDLDPESDDAMPHLQSSNDSAEATGTDEAAGAMDGDKCPSSNLDDGDEDGESITTSVSSITDHEDDENENEFMAPAASRGRKRSRHVARSSGLTLPPASSSLTEVQLNSYRILSRKERKGRKAQKRKNQRPKKQTGESDPDREEAMTGMGKRSASSERLISAIRALAYEPVLQSKAMQDQSQKIFLKSSFLDRQNHVIHHHHHSSHASSRKIKYATRPNTFSTNRKTNRNC